MKIHKLLYFVICILLFNCEPVKKIDIQGHRGARGLMPENSLAAFEKALDLGVTTLELDVAISKDHMVVVSHEPFMNHLICSAIDSIELTEKNEKAYNLYAMEYDSIKAYDCGTKPHPRFPDQKKLSVYKPLLSEVIEMAEKKNGSIKYNIEIKSDPSYDGIYTPKVSEFVQLVLEVISDKNVGERVTMQSFDIRAMEQIHSQDPVLSTALLIDNTEDIFVKLNSLSFKPSIISPNFGLLNESNVDKLHSEGFLIIPWTINEVVEMKNMIDLGVDGIITDYPDRLINLLSRK